MITGNFDEVLESFDAFIEEFTRKAEEAVRKYASDVVYRISLRTVQGDLDKHFELYQQRYQLLGLNPIPGFAAGSWTAGTTNAPVLQENNTGGDVSQAARFDAAFNLQPYKLGDTLFIKNAGPYIKEVDTKYQQANGLPPFLPLGVGIIQDVYAADFVQHYRDS